MSDRLQLVELKHGRLGMVVAPQLAMTCASLTFDDQELLWSPGPFAASLAEGRLLGIPLLHPWANRLSADRYGRLGRVGDVAAAPERLRRDPAGRALHGLRPASGAWTVVHRTERSIRGRVEHGQRAEELAAFPFPHVLEIELTLGDWGLCVETELTCLDGPVPVAYGFHPFLTLPGVARDRWRVALPRRVRVDLDDACMPVGTRSPADAEVIDLAGQSFDDAISGLKQGAALAVSGGAWRLTVVLDSGFGHAQLFAPAALELVSLEPMTAGTDALVTGRGLRTTRDTDTTSFTLLIEKDDDP